MNKALEKSIQKWRDIVDGNGVDKGGINCALCAEYGGDCDGCPVYEQLGFRWCDDSPYEAWVRYQRKCGKFHSASGRVAASVFDAESKRLAEAELTFLESLRYAK